GAAGFIGSSFVDRLLLDGHNVIGVDNFSTGRQRFLEKALTHPHFVFEKKDLLDPQALRGLMTEDVEWVFHFAANADVKEGLLHPEKDIQKNILVTWNILEAMRREGPRGIVFSSTGS